jgi:protein SCO1
LVSLVCLVTGQVVAEEPALRAGVFDPARPAPDFSLQGSHGSDLQLSNYRGKVILLGFGFTHCADVCPVTLAVLATALKNLGPAAADVQVIYITVDPERDTAQRMREYLKTFDLRFVGGTGTATQLAKVRRDYGISVGAKTAAPGGYAVSHSSYIYLIDQRGALKALMPYGSAPADYVHDLKVLLQRSVPP